MKISILSDIHDNVWNLKKAIAMKELQESETLLFCGDLCAPFIIKLLGQAYSKPIHIVLGNNDGDVAAIMANAANFSNIKIHGEYFRGEFGGMTIAMNHYPDNARKIAEQGNYEVVCYGHNHILSQEYIGDTLLINPGTIMGFHGGALKDVPATFITMHCGTRETKVSELRSS
ncbi:MAG: YfcE family phosphodiesterase [Flavobacteriaceae bacterium]